MLKFGDQHVLASSYWDMAQKAHARQGQGHSSRSFVKVTEIHTALRLLLLSKLETFDGNAIARFSSSDIQLHADHI